MLMTASLMMLESLLVSEILVISTFRILVILALGVKIEGEEGGADVDGGPLYDLGVVSPVQNVTVWMEGDYRPDIGPVLQTAKQSTLMD